MNKITRAIVPISEQSSSQALSKIDKIYHLRKKFDIVEIRADYWKDLDYPNLQTFIRQLPKDLKYRFTCRSRLESGPDKNAGYNLYSEDQRVNECMRINYIRTALPFTDIDIELTSNPGHLKLVMEEARHHKNEVTLSAHFWDTCPSGYELKQIVANMQELGGVPKIAIPVYSTRNALIGLNLINKFAKKNREISVAFIAKPGLEDIAKSARIASCLLGSKDQFFFYGDSNAPGQVAIQDKKYLLGKARNLQRSGDLDLTVKGFNRFAKSLFDN